MHTSGAGGSNPIPSDITRHQYAQDNILQNYELYIPELSSSHLANAQGPEYWILYVHGGYLRDPTVTSSSFHPALNQLVSSHQFSDIRPHVAGYVSIDYRLSPHPNHPQDPDTTSKYELRDAEWPDHLEDVVRAIAHLQQNYGFGRRYLLVGHSVGATMALLAILTTLPAGVDVDIEPPMVVLGVCGIYDFPRLHSVFPEYQELTTNAIPNEEDQRKASPALYPKATYEEAWLRGEDDKDKGERGKRKRTAVLAHSRSDGLVDWSQVEVMKGVLDAHQDGGDGETGGIDVRLLEIKGAHDEVWAQGDELAKAVAQAVKEMIKLEQEK